MGAAGAVALLSMGGTATVAGVSSGTRAALMAALMAVHIVAAVTIAMLRFYFGAHAA